MTSSIAQARNGRPDNSALSGSEMNKFIGTGQDLGLADKLLMLATHGEHFIAVLGDKGQGKSLLAENLHAELSYLNPVVFCSSEDLDEDDLLRQLGRDFGLKSRNEPINLAAFTEFAAAANADGRKPVVLIDDAHRLKDRTLNTLFSLLQRADIGLILFARPNIRRKKSFKLFQEKLYECRLNEIADQDLESYIRRRSDNELGLSEADLDSIMARSDGSIARVDDMLDDYRHAPRKGFVLPFMHLSVIAVIAVSMLGFWLINSGFGFSITSPDGVRANLTADLQPQLAGLDSEASMASDDAAELASSDDGSEGALNPTALNPTNSETVLNKAVVNKRAPELKAPEKSVEPVASARAEGIKLAVVGADLPGRQPIVSKDKIFAEISPAYAEPVFVEPLRPVLRRGIAADMSVVNQLTAASAITPVTSATPATLTTPATRVPAYRAPVTTLGADSWIASARASEYTLQMMGSHSEEKIQDFIRDQVDREKLSYFRTLRQNKAWYVMTWGRYPDRDAALFAIEQLPPGLKAQKPWARGVASIQSSLSN